MTEQNMNTIQNDAVVQLAYNLVVDGEEIESDVLEYLHGHENIITGLENALTGLQVGDTKEVLVRAEDAYGEFDPDAVVMVTRASFPPDFEIRLGEPMRLQDASGHVFTGVATALFEDAVELDLNHPMAGKDLQFTVTVLSIRPATEDELAAGRVNYGCDEGCADGCSDGCCN
ncbi:MAG TPA: peptidylprolyl isomerase [Anaerolineaceae bacterium]|nr:peptidylprolyl isomerase [Anaerolineaceae bacterium]